MNNFEKWQGLEPPIAPHRAFIIVYLLNDFVFVIYLKAILIVASIIIIAIRNSINCAALVYNVYVWAYKKIYNVTNLKSHSKGRYFVFKKSLFKNYNKWLVWSMEWHLGWRCFPGFVMSQSGPIEYHSNESHLQKFE